MRYLTRSSFLLLPLIVACGSRGSGGDKAHKTQPDPSNGWKEFDIEYAKSCKESSSANLQPAQVESVCACTLKKIQEKPRFGSPANTDPSSLLTTAEVTQCTQQALDGAPKSNSDSDKPQPTLPPAPDVKVETWTIDQKNLVVSSCERGLKSLAWSTPALASSYCGCTTAALTSKYKPSEFAQLDASKIRAEVELSKCEQTSGFADAKANYLAVEAEKERRRLGLMVLAQDFSGDSFIYAGTVDQPIGIIPFRDLAGNYIPSTVHYNLVVQNVSGPCEFSGEANSSNFIEISASLASSNPKTEVCEGKVTLTRLDSKATSSMNFYIVGHGR